MGKKRSAAELKEEGTALGAQIDVARKRPVNFALLMGKEGLVLETDLKRNCEVLWRNAKKAGGGSKGAMGTMSVSGRVIELTCVDDSAPSHLPKLAKKWLTERGQPYKVTMITPSGSVGDEHDEDEEKQVANVDSGLMTDAMEEQGASVPGSDVMEGEEEEIQMRPAPESQSELNTQSTEGPDGDAPEGPAGPLIDAPVKIGNEPAKRELTAEFGQVRKDLLKSIAKAEDPAREAIQQQIAQFGELVKSNDLTGAERLMDELSLAQETVTESQRTRARERVSQIATMVGDIEAELDALEAELNKQEAAQ